MVINLRMFTGDILIKNFCYNLRNFRGLPTYTREHFSSRPPFFFFFARFYTFIRRCRKFHKISKFKFDLMWLWRFDRTSLGNEENYIIPFCHQIFSAECCGKYSLSVWLVRPSVTPRFTFVFKYFFFRNCEADLNEILYSHSSW